MWGEGRGRNNPISTTTTVQLIPQPWFGLTRSLYIISYTIASFRFVLACGVVFSILGCGRPAIEGWPKEVIRLETEMYIYCNTENYSRCRLKCQRTQREACRNKEIIINTRAQQGGGSYYTPPEKVHSETDEPNSRTDSIEEENSCHQNK